MVEFVNLTLAYFDFFKSSNIGSYIIAIHIVL